MISPEELLERVAELRSRLSPNGHEARMPSPAAAHGVDPLLVIAAAFAAGFLLAKLVGLRSRAF